RVYDQSRFRSTFHCNGYRVPAECHRAVYFSGNGPLVRPFPGAIRPLGCRGHPRYEFGCWCQHEVWRRGIEGGNHIQNAPHLMDYPCTDRFDAEFFPKRESDDEVPVVYCRVYHHFLPIELRSRRGTTVYRFIHHSQTTDGGEPVSDWVQRFHWYH